MLWALLFSLLLNNDPAFVLPKLDKQVKKHITDKERKNEILDLRKASKKQRKSYMKDKRKLIKKFDKLNRSRETTQNEFTKIFSLIENERKVMQDADIERIIQIQSLIYSEEWNNMFTDLESGFKKHKKQEKKELRILDKQYQKVIKKVNNTVATDSTKKNVLVEAEIVYTNIKNYINVYYTYIANANSIIYQSDYTEIQLKEVINTINDTYDQVYLSAMEGHFTVLELTTEKEWNKIMKQIIKL